MSSIVNVHEAKTHFSRLIDRAHAGEEITVSKAGKPWVKIIKVDEQAPFKRQPGGWPELAALCDDAMTSAMTEADLDGWEQKILDI